MTARAREVLGLTGPHDHALGARSSLHARGTGGVGHEPMRNAVHVGDVPSEASPAGDLNGPAVLPKCGMLGSTPGSDQATPPSQRCDGQGRAVAGGTQHGSGTGVRAAHGWRRWVPYDILKAKRVAALEQAAEGSSQAEIMSCLESHPVTPHVSLGRPERPCVSYVGHKNRLKELISGTVEQGGRPNDDPNSPVSEGSLVTLCVYCLI